MNVIKIILLSLLTVFLSSCYFNGDSEYVIDRFNTDKIVINFYSNDSMNVSRNELKIKDSYTISNNYQFECFDDLLSNPEITDYCCCPNENFSVDFYKNDKVISTYLIDNFQFKDKIRFYDDSFQFSYLISKSKWNDFLIKLKK